MHDIFPLGAGVSKVRGIVTLIKENNGSIAISELAEEAEEDLDALLPLIDACRMLGFVKVDDSDIKLTEEGEKLSRGSPYRIIRGNLKKVEPFKTVFAALAKKRLTTPEILELLDSKGIYISEDSEGKESVIKKLLRLWGVRTKLLFYNEETDKWSLR